MAQRMHAYVCQAGSRRLACRWRGTGRSCVHANACTRLTMLNRGSAPDAAAKLTSNTWPYDPSPSTRFTAICSAGKARPRACSACARGATASARRRVPLLQRARSGAGAARRCGSSGRWARPSPARTYTINPLLPPSPCGPECNWLASPGAGDGGKGSVDPPRRGRGNCSCLLATGIGRTALPQVGFS
jgi:hypothetical protein